MRARYVETQRGPVMWDDDIQNFRDRLDLYDGPLDSPARQAVYRQPTVWDILKRQGIRAAINYKCERLCAGAFANMHDDARKHGYTLARPGYKMPWWFKLASKLEWYTRPKRK